VNTDTSPPETATSRPSDPTIAGVAIGIMIATLSPSRSATRSQVGSARPLAERSLGRRAGDL